MNVIQIIIFLHLAICASAQVIYQKQRSSTGNVQEIEQIVLQEVKQQLQVLISELTKSLRTEISGLKSSISNIQTQVAAMKNNANFLSSRVTNNYNTLNNGISSVRTLANTVNNFARGYSVSCSWTSYLNDYDETFTYKVRSGYVIRGMHSVHYNTDEDRRFKFYICS